jgi:hypothetical protein
MGRRAGKTTSSTETCGLLIPSLPDFSQDKSMEGLERLLERLEGWCPQRELRAFVRANRWVDGSFQGFYTSSLN